MTQIVAIAPDEIPEGVSGYLTAGKAYAVLKNGRRGFYIDADNGAKTYCLWRSCAHLDGRDWRREERAESPAS